MRSDKEEFQRRGGRAQLDGALARMGARSYDGGGLVTDWP
jgi:hypothetical protein